jgi:hypothetical protein
MVYSWLNLCKRAQDAPFLGVLSTRVFKCPRRAHSVPFYRERVKIRLVEKIYDVLTERERQVARYNPLQPPVQRVSGLANAVQQGPCLGRRSRAFPSRSWGAGALRVP